MICANVASQTALSHNTKPVYRKTCVLNRKLSTKFSKPTELATTGILIIKHSKQVSNSPWVKYNRDVEAATVESSRVLCPNLSEHTSVPETGKEFGTSNICCDLEDALSVYEAYTIP